MSTGIIQTYLLNILNNSRHNGVIEYFDWRQKFKHLYLHILESVSAGAGPGAGKNLKNTLQR